MGSSCPLAMMSSAPSRSELQSRSSREAGDVELSSSPPELRSAPPDLQTSSGQVTPLQTTPRGTLLRTLSRPLSRVGLFNENDPLLGSDYDRAAAMPTVSASTSMSSLRTASPKPPMHPGRSMLFSSINRSFRLSLTEDLSRIRIDEDYCGNDEVAKAIGSLNNEPQERFSSESEEDGESTFWWTTFNLLNDVLAAGNVAMPYYMQV